MYPSDYRLGLLCFWIQKSSFSQFLTSKTTKRMRRETRKMSSFYYNPPIHLLKFRK